MKNIIYMPRGLGFFAEPFELFLAFASVFSGVLLLTGQSKPVSVATQLPGWQLSLWALLFVVGGLLIIVSRATIAAAKTEFTLERGLRLEAVGITVFGGAAAMYAISLVALGGPGLFSGIITGAWATASFFRLYIINRQWAPYRRARKVTGGG
jgi:hypothetical protein